MSAHQYIETYRSRVCRIDKKITYLNSEFLGLTSGIELESMNDDGSHAISVECMACGSKNQFPNVALEYRNGNSINLLLQNMCLKLNRPTLKSVRHMPTRN